MGMLHALQHLKLVVHHLLVPFDIFLEDDLDRHFPSRAIRLSDNAIGTGSECATETVFRSKG